jgi:hypothetical protein
MSIVDLQSHKPRRRRGPNPHTKEHKLLSGIDLRTREGKFLVNARRELTAHVGNPNSVQKRYTGSLVLAEGQHQPLGPSSMGGS